MRNILKNNPGKKLTAQQQLSDHHSKETGRVSTNGFLIAPALAAALLYGPLY